MFWLTMAGAMLLAELDVCLTPVATPAGPVPTPLPYPNFGDTGAAVAALMNILVGGAPALNQMSEIPVSSGDEAGTYGGVVSLLFGAKISFVEGIPNVAAGGMPVVTLCGLTSQNLDNAPGAAITPSQVTVMVGA
ncbi:DUF4150 domain-containing protein [Paraburkholderia hayleyella]|uniref:DUF4150 domain-containing protein n=1 Tax=Paraburkholderia hayleyella TaxID=2152889 RepID=UPI001292564F|nr:DUF4150 domain-containing protein [Paraburkholderia hayleyella]